jgi:hypothetical protein
MAGRGSAVGVFKVAARVVVAIRFSSFRKIAIHSHIKYQMQLHRRFLLSRKTLLTGKAVFA